MSAVPKKKPRGRPKKTEQEPERVEEEPESEEPESEEPKKRGRRSMFTEDQKQMLLKFFDDGMTSTNRQHMDLIEKCAKEADTTVDRVKRFIGAENYKRRQAQEENDEEKPRKRKTDTNTTSKKKKTKGAAQSKEEE